MGRKRIGKLFIPSGLAPETHELEIVAIFINSGSDVSFLKPRVGYKVKTPDILMDGIEWELKSPKGNSRTTISNQLSRGSKQARNLIIDTSRTKLEDELILRQLQRNIQEHRSVKHLILVTKTQAVIVVK